MCSAVNLTLDRSVGINSAAFTMRSAVVPGLAQLLGGPCGDREDYGRVRPAPRHGSDKTRPLRSSGP